MKKTRNQKRRKRNNRRRERDRRWELRARRDGGYLITGERRCQKIAGVGSLSMLTMIAPVILSPFVSDMPIRFVDGGIWVSTWWADIEGPVLQDPADFSFRRGMMRAQYGKGRGSGKTAIQDLRNWYDSPIPPPPVPPEGLSPPVPIAVPIGVKVKIGE